MSKTISISPMTRIEGHLAIHTETDTLDDGSHFIKHAKCEGEMFRGIENILRGRDPLDAQQITQRICGVCPISHGMASIMAQEMAYGIKPTRNGRLGQNLILAANYIQSHILHFYHLAALDFVDITAVLNYSGDDPTLQSLKNWVKNSLDKNMVFAGAPFLPRYEVDQYVKDDAINWKLISSYVSALKMRTIAHEMAAVFSAKMPHSTSLVPGGVTGKVNMERVLAYKSRLSQLSTFINTVYIPDLVQAAAAFPDYWETGQGCNNYLSYGVFRMTEDTGEHIQKMLPAGVVIDGQYSSLDSGKIHEFVGYSRYSSPSNLHPYEGRTQPAPENGYSWLKAPRYDGHVTEVGPLARVIVAYYGPGNDWLKQEVDQVLKSVNLTPDKLNSVLGRHLARGLEAKWLAAQCGKWLDQMEFDKPMAREFSIPAAGRGFGLTEAPRGALGHWMIIEDHKIKSYQCIVPTTWNCSPRDDNNNPGPVETALEGTIIQDTDQPIEAARIVRSFDPCIACAVH